MEVKRALICSDSHGRNDNIIQALQAEGEIDLFIHLGDVERNVSDIQRWTNCPCYMVMGNCDSPMLQLPNFTIIDIGKHKIFAAHGHRYWVQMGTENLEQNARMYGCDVAMYGHTHCPVIRESNGITVVNPGSISLPRQKGFDKTYMIMTQDEEGKLDFELKILE